MRSGVDSGKNFASLAVELSRVERPGAVASLGNETSISALGTRDPNHPGSRLEPSSRPHGKRGNARAQPKTLDSEVVSKMLIRNQLEDYLRWVKSTKRLTVRLVSPSFN
jgi:hypothetical protein